jgi:hypothetical protein
MDYINEVQELTQAAQEKEFLSFAEKAKEILMKKTAEKLAEKGYFRKMDQAKGIFEEEDEKDDDEDNEDDEDEKDNEDED